MEIARVTTKEHYRYIPIKGLDSVEEALNTFARGITVGSRDTEVHQVEAVGASQGSFAQAFYLYAAPHVRGADNSFVQQRIMVDARLALRNRTKWSRSFDYDGMGSFFKTSVDIEVLDRKEELYALGLYAAYVGDKPEEGLAQYLGVSRALTWAAVEVETQPISNNCFEFDFEYILRKLDEDLGTQWAVGEQVAQAMMTITSYGESNDVFVLYEDEDVTIEIRLGDVQRRFHYDKDHDYRNPIDTWTVEGSILRGRLRESYEEKGKMAPPTFTISLCSVHKDELSRAVPIWDPDKKDLVLKVRDTIAEDLAPQE